MSSKARKCEQCNGTGYQSAPNPLGLPAGLAPIGTWPCTFCQGKGEFQEIELTDEMVEKIKKQLEADK